MYIVWPGVRHNTNREEQLQTSEKNERILSCFFSVHESFDS